MLKLSCFTVRKLVEIDKNVNLICGCEEKCEFVGENEGENEKYDEFSEVGKVFDIMSSRKMVKFDRGQVDVAYDELDKERNASSSAGAEAMAMILRLQSDKSSLQMRVNQLERLAEEKKLYDHDVVESLEWTIMKHDCQRCLLDNQLRVCREKLKMFMNDEEWDRFESVFPTLSACSSSSYGGNKFEDVIVSSLSLEVSPI